MSIVHGRTCGPAGHPLHHAVRWTSAALARPSRARWTLRALNVPASTVLVRDTAVEVLSYRGRVLKNLLGFLGPAMLIPLGDPLMALADTIFVGQFAGTTELAAMGPANMVFSFSLYIFRSLQVATQSLVATHLHQGQRQEAAQYLGCGLTLAIAMGCLGAAVLSLGSGWLIPATGVRDAALIQPSADYLRIRGLALPAVLVAIVAQSGKLAQHDSLTPCLSVALTVAVSLVANLVFVAWLGWGLKGAAITTVATQYLGAAALLWALHHKSSQLVPNWSLPSTPQLLSYLATMAPLTAMFVAKNICYLIAQSAAAGLTMASLAAHQAAFTLWTLFTWAMAPLEHATMAFMPTATQRWQQLAMSQLVLELATGTAVVAGLLLAGMLVGAPGLMVKDATVQPLVSAIAPWAALSLTLMGLDMAASSINIALQDGHYVARSYLVTLAVTAGYFAVCRQQQWGLGGVWWGLAVFCGARCMQSVSRVMWMTRRWSAAEVGHTASSVPITAKAAVMALGAESSTPPANSTVAVQLSKLSEDRRAPIASSGWGLSGSDSADGPEPASNVVPFVLHSHKGYASQEAA